MFFIDVTSSFLQSIYFSHQTATMGRKGDLKTSEKETIIKLLGRGSKTIDISKQLKRDHRTIKAFVADSQHSRTRCDKGKMRTIKSRQITVLKRAVANNPLSTSRKVFSEAGVDGVSKTTRWRTLQQIATVRTAQKRPVLKGRHKKERIKWAVRYMKTDFSTVLFTDECRATMDGPDGFSRGWCLDGLDVPVRLKRQQGGGGVMFWAGLLGNRVVGPFRVPEGVKLNACSYKQFLADNFLPWLNTQQSQLQESIVFMQDNAPSHNSRLAKGFLEEHGFVDERYMEWPAASPDLNPIENYWAAVKAELYAGGRQFITKDALWNGILEACAAVDPTLPKTLTKSVDSRLVSVLQKHGNYISK